MNKIYLLPGKDSPIRKHHHWIFSGAIDRGFDFPDGEIATVYSSEHQFLGFGYFNRRPKTITGRMISFEKEDPIVAMERNITNAIDLRKKLFQDKDTNCYRVINGEGDMVPGLVVDRYGDALAIQVGTLGIEKLKDGIVALLVKLLHPKVIYEKSKLPSRIQEGLDPFEGTLYGDGSTKVEVVENGIKFIVDLENSHKTGLYLDQREMRSMIGEYAKGKKILNCFSYTCGFSLYAARAGAAKVTSIDISSEVLEQGKENFKVNGLDASAHEFLAKDVFDYLDGEHKLDYDIVILDPPAFAKKREDVPNALNGYKKINKDAIAKMPSGSFLLTCSCSYNVDEQMFEEVVRRAAGEARRDVKILSRHRLAMDHTLNIFHQEMDYLKGLFLYVE